ncbi:MAG TPA: hypothetical protein V6D27_11500 [Vampirovibrionales bacterium]
MTDPLFWLGLSFLLVAVSLILVLLAALPALQAIARAARSVEKLADTLSREFPPTLEAIRLTGMEISDLTDDVTEGVQSASNMVKEVDRSLGSAKQQAKKVQITTRSLFTGMKTAWKTFKNTSERPSSSHRRSVDRLPPSQRQPLEFNERSAPQPYSFSEDRDESSEDYSD